MNALIKHQLPYTQDCRYYFSAIHHEPWAMWLDSCSHSGALGRYDIIVARPHTTLITRSGVTAINVRDSERISYDDPFELLREFTATSNNNTPIETGLFSGGAVGYLSYDLARTIEQLPSLALSEPEMPEMLVGIYDWALVCDHHERSCQLLSLNADPSTADIWPELIQIFDNAVSIKQESLDDFSAESPPQSNMSLTQYRRGFERIQSYLEEGDCYQVNFAQRFSVQVTGSPWSGYQKLRKYTPVPFAAYLNTPYGQVLSLSPERFLKLEEGRVETRPIKGTRPRSKDAGEDQRLAEELLQSEKDRAENLMIVDLLRNDLGKCCRPGTISVPQLFSVEHYATVHHLVSKIEGELDDKNDAVSLLRHCFPGGSITGAPKLRAMEIIEELEPHRRGVYCGSIFYLAHNGDMDSNITIRTALHQDGDFYFSAGGGIVRDSECEAEYQETYDKAAGMMRLFD